MKVKIDDIIEALEFENDISESYLNTKTGQVCMYTDDELRAAESNEDLSESAEWYREAVARAKQYLENLNDYMPLPSKYDFNEYRVMERFISRVAIPKQAEVLSQAIQSKGAFQRFKTKLETLELVDQWYEFREQNLLEFVTFWCAENQIDFEE